MLSALKNRAAEHLQNAPGWRTNERIVVIESDDWGAVRTKDQGTLHALQRIEGIETSLFDSLDCLESSDDLACLAEVLRAVTDRDDRPAKLTANTVMGNPDFAAIVENGFETFKCESFFESYERYQGTDLAPLWRALIDEGVWNPQFHADYHLDTERWMADLRAGVAGTRDACRYHFYGQKQTTGCAGKRHYLAAFHAESGTDVTLKGERVIAGLKRFRETFGFNSKTFIPCNYIWASDLDSVLKDAGVATRQGNRVGLKPSPEVSGALTSQRRYWRAGNNGQLGQSVRNVMFEPYSDGQKDWAARALAQVHRAFWWRKPAVITTHRINYVSGLDAAHRDRSLRQLEALLSGIIRRWPDVQFLSSDELADRMAN
jgi:hypothetical protein